MFETPDFLAQDAPANDYEPSFSAYADTWVPGPPFVASDHLPVAFRHAGLFAHVFRASLNNSLVSLAICR